MAQYPSFPAAPANYGQIAAQFKQQQQSQQQQQQQQLHSGGPGPRPGSQPQATLAGLSRAPPPQPALDQTQPPPFQSPIHALSAPGRAAIAPNHAAQHSQNSLPSPSQFARPSPLPPNVTMQAAVQASPTTPTSAASMRAAGSVAIPQQPLSPQALAIEERRVSLLLEINAVLIREVTRLQSQSRGSDASPPNADGSAPPAMDVSSLQEYKDCMRRLQMNLAYLASLAESAKKPNGRKPDSPQIMSPPPWLPDLDPLYAQLRQLFPGSEQSTVNKAMATANAQTAQRSQAT